VEFDKIDQMLIKHSAFLQFTHSVICLTPGS